MTQELKLAAVILAGGQASRYGGEAKGLIELTPGTSIVGRMIAEIRRSGIVEIAISANDPAPYAGFGLPVVADLRSGAGPLGGIEAGLAHFRDKCEAVLFLPCDLPGITENEISALISAFKTSGARVVFARDGSFFDHPLCSVVHNGVVGAVSEFLRDGGRKVSDLWATLGAVAVRFDTDVAFFNVNTPGDLCRWRGDRPLRGTISVPMSVLNKVEDWVREGADVEIVKDGEAVVRIVEAESRVECDSSTLHIGGWITCSTARSLAESLSVTRKQVGTLMDLLDIKIRDCELGCF